MGSPRNPRPGAPGARAVLGVVGAVGVLAVLSLAACVDLPHVVSSPNPLWADAAGHVRHDALSVLCVDLWEEMLRADPVRAGRLGDARYLGELPDESPEALAARRVRLAELARRADLIWEGDLEPDEQVTLAMARRALARALALHDAHFELWLVSPRRGPHVELWSLAEDQPTEGPEQRRALLQRWAAMPRYVDTATANLRRGLERGLVANHTSVARTLAQLDRLLAQDTSEWPLAAPELPADFTGPPRRVVLERVHALLDEQLRPALVRHRDALRDEVLPRARDDERPGLASLPGGRPLYDELIEVYTGLARTAEELHQTGLDEVARIRAEMAALGEVVLGTSDVAEIQRQLREDPVLHFDSRDEVEATARACVERAGAALGAWFGLLPQAPCEVVRVPAVEERETTIAYYRGPAADGSLPGRYFVNTYAPATRPRYEAEVLAFHEAIPGHHLQIAIAAERDGLPVFQRHSGETAYVEGWALYTERLSDEMGLYSGDLDRLGVLSFDAWRACRLVVDTGLHAMGWSRSQAIDYLYDNTLLARGNVENEVDRYITSPGQALAYKVGQLEILALREQALGRLGQRFDIRAFHDVVLRDGGVTLDILRANVERWVDAELARAAAEAAVARGEG